MLYLHALDCFKVLNLLDFQNFMEHYMYTTLNHKLVFVCIKLNMASNLPTVHKNTFVRNTKAFHKKNIYEQML